ncbi:tetratricopeptide repeat protein [Paracrocinitomix mangrovi]|uniref:tetratricopeptide repeat protein n=1 Tax=Paracrocinitomix mangrovi TaxID=2862509 RepID=UPI001C8E2289|nr:tetratricopeptide repeat protein [Paracrocinitomix mangrovi]UKN00821.1 tetratricopeptide repeat protein [Paracrocinitomix mangrovi]
MKVLLSIICLVSFNFLFAQNNKQDQVKEFEQQLENTNSDTTKIRLLTQIGNHGKSFDIEKAQNATEKALMIAQSITDRFYISMALNTHSNILTYQGQYAEAMEYTERALDVLQADTVKLENNNKKTNKQLGKIYNQHGMVHDFNSEFPKAIKYYLKAQEIFKYIEDLDGLGVTYNNLGITYLYTSNFEDSEECFKNSYDLYLTMQDTTTAYQARMNLGIVAYYKQDYEKAIQMYKESLEVMRRIGNLRSAGHCITNIGETYAIIGEYDSALAYSAQGVQVDIELNDKEGLGTDYRMRGKIYSEMGQYDSARYYSLEGLEIAKEINRKVDIISALVRLTEIEKQDRKFEQALKYHEEYLVYHDSLQKENNNKEIGKVEAEHEFNKQLAIEKAENTQRLKTEEEKRKRQSVILYFSFGILAVISFFVYMLIKSLNQTKKQKELVQEAKIEIEQKNTELLDSIKYAQRIQEALLRDDDQHAHLPQHFILFKPKDIVSGDFFWSYVNHNHWYIAVADCTGHGVPGAMLTMLGTAYLNEICAKEEDASPGFILDQLKAKITTELSQKGLQGESKDGMDISLIRIDLNTKKAIWAGANNPLYYIKSESIEEIKANKQPIGYSDQVTAFDDHNIQFQEGDMVYLFSDGYADQFGGDKGKKFKYSNFKQLLINLHKESLDVQKQQLDDTIENWRGSIEQLDDICIIGIKI